MKQNLRFIQQFPVEKNNQQNYTEILNMTIFTYNLQHFIMAADSNVSHGLNLSEALVTVQLPTKLKLIFTRKINYRTRLR